MLFVFRALLVASGAIIVLFLALSALRKGRMLNRRIGELRREEAESGRPPDPYAALAELYENEAPKDRKARGKR